MVTNAVDRNRYADWLKAAIDSNGLYHNHKETMAWTATAFYLPAAFGLGYWANRVIVATTASILFTILVVLATYLVYRFLNMQFRMRWKAADIAVGLRRAMARVCADTIPQSEAELEVDYGHHKAWPRFIQSEIDLVIEESKKRRTLAAFAKGLLYEASAIFDKKKKDEEMKVDDRLWTEVPSYFGVIAATMVAIALVWW